MVDSLQEQLGFDPFSDAPVAIGQAPTPAQNIGFDPFEEPVQEPESTFVGTMELLRRGTADLPIGIAQFITERFDDTADLGFSIEGQPITAGDLRRSLANVTAETEALAEREGIGGQIARTLPQIAQVLPIGGTKLLTGGLRGATALGKVGATGAKALELGLRGAGTGGVIAGAQPISELDKEVAERKRIENFELGTTVGAIAPFAIPAFTKTVSAAGKAIFNPIKSATNIATSEISPLVSTTRKAMNDFFAQRGLLIEHKVGESLTLGQLTGSRFIQSLEGSLRRGALTSDKFFNKTQKQLQAGMNAVNRQLDKITPRNVGSEQLGAQVKSAFNKAVNTQVNNRTAQAKIDFDVLHRATSGNKVLDVRNVVDELEDMVTAGSQKGATDAEISAAKKAKEIAESLAGKVSSKQYQELLQRFGRAATGKLSISRDLTKGENIAMGARIFGKLKDGLDDNVLALRARPLKRGDRSAELLQIARERYKYNSEAIEILESTRIANALRGAAGKFGTERVEDALFAMKPSELRQTLSIIRINAPETIPDIQRAFLQRSFDHARQQGKDFVSGLTPLTQAKRPVKFLANAFNKSLPDDDVMDMLFPGLVGKKVKQEMGEVVDFILRVGQDTGLEGSQTFALQEAGRVASALTSAKKVALLAFEFGSKGRLADILIDPTNRKLLLEVAKSPNSIMGKEAAAAISGILTARINEQ